MRVPSVLALLLPYCDLTRSSALFGCGDASCNRQRTYRQRTICTALRSTGKEERVLHDPLYASALVSPEPRILRHGKTPTRADAPQGL